MRRPGGGAAAVGPTSMSSSSWWVRPPLNARRAREGGTDLGEAQDVAVEVAGALEVTHVEHRVAELDRLHRGTTFPAGSFTVSLVPSTPPDSSAPVRTLPH